MGDSRRVSRAAAGKWLVTTDYPSAPDVGVAEFPRDVSISHRSLQR